MQIYYKLLGKIQNNKARLKKVVGIVSVAVGLRYGKINSIPTSLSSNSTQQVEQVQNFVEEDIQVIDTDCKVIKTGSGILLGSSPISEGSKSTLETRGGDEGFWKFGPGSKARGTAKGNGGKTRNSSIFADGFVPQQTYCHYHKSDPPVSCKTILKTSDNLFQGNGNNPPPEDASNSNCDLSKYKGGPSPLTVQGGDLGKSGPGPRAKADASRNTKAGVNQVGHSKASNSQSGGSPFAEALTTNHPTQSRPGQNKDGRFSRFPSQAKPDPYNPGCSRGPWSVKVLSVEGRPVSEQRNSDSATEHSIQEIIAHDGVKGRLTDKSANHLTSKHGDVFGIDDPLPPSPNQKVGKFTKIRTRINKDNKKQFADTLEKILQDPNSEPYPDVNMRGIKGHGYYNENYGEHGFFVGIHNEGKFKGQIMKAQPISEQQLEILQDENKMD